ncbi:MAG TPA: single-stranded-DNA-specific exonuclease RecJ, partial [Kiritimatiellia bacterium]
AALLAGRGYDDPTRAERFLKPRLSDLSDPFDLPAMDKAVDRIWRAIDAGERIAIYGDYDVDGITSSALLSQVLAGLGAKVSVFLPHRLDEGYGLSMDGMQRCLEEHQPGLIVTVDCGTGSVEPVRALAERGVDVVITDHHTPPAEVAPAVAVVNPKLCNHAALQVLAGVGVTFKVCHALLKSGRAAGRTVASLDLRKHLDLVALGTISDVVPLIDESRTLARHGLAQVNETESTGLRALIDVAGIRGTIDAYEVGFLLGPRLNAAGRLGDALQSLELLVTRDAGRARAIASHLDTTNRERQEIEKRTLKEALAAIDAEFDPVSTFGIVVAGEGWHAGVIGIVASRLVQRYYRPSVVIAIDGGSGRGSCRSIEGCDLVERLGVCSSLLLKFGGHSMAAGLEVDAGRIGEFKRAFNESVAGVLRGTDLRPVQRIDAWMALADADDRMLDALDGLRPFGHGNPTPVWAARSVCVVGRPRPVGQGHLKFTVASGGVQREAIAFNFGDRVLPDGEMDIAFQMKRDTYQGREKLVLQIQDVRPAELCP